MKPITLCATLLGALLATAVSAQVQSTAPTEKRLTQVQFEEQVNRVMLSADYLVQELGLGEEQAGKLASIEADINQRERAIAGLDPEVRAPRQEALSAERARQIASVFTPAQLKQAEELKRQVVLSQFGEPVDAPVQEK